VEWDVINEPFANHDLMDILGREEMVEWFKMAKNLDPKPRLFINDYPSLDGAATSNPHLNHFYDTITFLQKNGAPLEGIGFQGHFGSNVVPPERVLSGLDRFAKFGLPIAITEFDMDTQDEDLQARYMRDFLTATFSHPSVDSVIMWGFWEGRHWMPNAALYRQDWSIKPHGQVWLDLVKKAWWTNAQGATNTKGEYSTRGFYGDYIVTVNANGKTKTVNAKLQKGKSGPVTIKLN
jgi:endo-1,4-beta-xylanase